MKNETIEAVNMLLDSQGLPLYSAPPGYSRALAFEEGRSKYKSDKPCRRGHDPIRYTNTGACVKCVALYARKYRTRGPE